MSRYIIFFLLTLPSLLFSNEIDIEKIIEIDVLVSIEGLSPEDSLKVDLTKYTVDGKGVNIKLMGYDGAIKAMLTPEIVEEERIRLVAMCEVTDLKDKVIKTSDEVLETSLNEKILFYPLGGVDIEPRVIMEITLNRFSGI